MNFNIGNNKLLRVCERRPPLSIQLIAESRESEQLNAEPYTHSNKKWKVKCIAHSEHCWYSNFLLFVYFGAFVFAYFFEFLVSIKMKIIMLWRMDNKRNDVDCLSARLLNFFYSFQAQTQTFFPSKKWSHLYWNQQMRFCFVYIIWDYDVIFSWNEIINR